MVLNNLYKLTQLQTSFGVNMVALVDGVPRTLNLVDALRGYVSHQVEVITRRTEFRLEQGAASGAHILEGRIKALNVIDEIIALIRASDDAAAAKAGLMAAPYEFSELQAIDILDMQLRQLTRLSRIDLEKEIERPARADHRAAEHPRRPGEAARRHQGRADRDQGGVRHAARVPDRARHAAR